MRAAAALLIACCTALSPHAGVLHRCGSKTPPNAAEATAALRAIVAAPRQDDWAPLYDTRWRPVFSLKPDAEAEPFDDEGRRASFQSVGPFEVEFERAAEESDRVGEGAVSLELLLRFHGQEASLVRVWFDREDGPPARVEEWCPVVLARVHDLS